MINFKTAIAGHNISVTNTAGTLKSFIDTALSADSGIPQTVDCVVIQPEDGDIRVTMDGTTPTASLGELIMQGEKKTIYGRVSKMLLIRAGSANVACSVSVGWREI